MAIETGVVDIRSDVFEAGGKVPKRYTGEGEDVSPPLRWMGIPPESKEVVLIVDDPDAPTPQPFVHWVIYNIPASSDGLSEGIMPSLELDLPQGARQGKNSDGRIGYMGPMPPKGHGVHRYRFHVYALNKKFNLRAGLTKEQMLDAISGSVIAEGELVGTYERL